MGEDSVSKRKRASPLVDVDSSCSFLAWEAQEIRKLWKSFRQQKPNLFTANHLQQQVPSTT